MKAGLRGGILTGHGLFMGQNVDIDASGGEGYLAEFVFECHNPDRRNQESLRRCAGHAGESWEPQTCRYREVSF